MRSVASRIRDALEAPRCSGLGLGLRTVPLVEVALHGLHQVGCGVKVGLAVPWHRCRPHRPTDATDRWASMRFGFLTGTRVTGTISYRPLRRARAGRLVRLGRTRKVGPHLSVFLSPFPGSERRTGAAITQRAIFLKCRSNGLGRSWPAWTTSRPGSAWRPPSPSPSAGAKRRSG